MPQLTEAATDGTRISQNGLHFPREAVYRTPASEVKAASIATVASATAASRGIVRLSYFSQLARVGLSLLVSDLTAILLCLVVSFGVVLWFGRPISHFPAFLTICTSACLASLWVAGCYPAVGMAPAKELRKIFRGSLAACLALAIGLLTINNSITPYLQMIVIAFPLLVVLIPLARGVMKDWMQKHNISIPFYFVGDRHDVLQAYQEMSRYSWTLLSPVGRFSSASRGSEAPRGLLGSEYSQRLEQDVPYLGNVGDALALANHSHVNWLFFVGDPADSAHCKYIKRLEQVFPQVVWIAPQHGTTASATTVLNCGLAVGLRAEKSLLLFGPRLQKRAIDIVVSSVLLILLSPILLAIGLLVRLTSRGPILLKNPRIGQDGRVFHAWKFRSMVANAEEVLEQSLQSNPTLKAEWDKNHKLKIDPRVTGIGWFLRKTSLDELPQLWNVLVGQMSLVGPRPILTEEVAKYGDTYRDYLRVRPGITGLWQVSGRNNTSYPERLVMVRYYVHHWSPWLDLHILLRTFRTVLLCEGSY